MALRVKNAGGDIVPINQSVTEAAALISDYQKSFGAVAHGIKLNPEKTLYEVLEAEKLLVRYVWTLTKFTPHIELMFPAFWHRPSFPRSLGVNLIEQGELGLAMFNGQPAFLAPGRHTLWSVLDSLIKVTPLIYDLVTANPNLFLHF
jgi:hypothetical protein